VTAVGTDPRAPLLEVRGLRKTYSTGGLFKSGRRVIAAEDVAFRIHRGEAVALVGESGSGKSTIARLLMRLEAADGGEALLDGVDVFRREPRRASRGYRRRVQMVFQDPFGSLNPAHDIEHHLTRPLLRLHSLNPAHDVAHHLHRPAVSLGGAAASARVRAIELLRTVGLEPAEEFIHRHPYELSGGQRQRVAIARSLAADPDLLVADEPTSMLDVSIRMGILNLLAQLKRERGLAILLITHDLASARFLAERIVVLYRGRVVEDGPSDAVVGAPAHPYTRALLASIAGLEGGAESRAGGTSTAASGAGCPFADRCAEVHDLCRCEDPAPREHDGRRVRCHLYPAAPARAAGR
jgi:peptide/nickel transport system ATP-binding protein